MSFVELGELHYLTQWRRIRRASCMVWCTLTIALCVVLQQACVASTIAEGLVERQVCVASTVAEGFVERQECVASTTAECLV